jgi:type I restriction enzyme R subunit
MLQPIQDVSMLFWQRLLLIMPLNIINLFKEIQKKKQAENPDYVPLNIACVFSPPAEWANKKKRYSADSRRFNTRERRQQTKSRRKEKSTKNHYCRLQQTIWYKPRSSNEFDLYYQDVQRRIKDQNIATKTIHTKIKLTLP